MSARPCFKLVSSLGTAAALAVWPVIAVAEAPVSGTTGSAGVIAEAQQLERAGKAHEAVELLKPARSSNPSSEPLAVALGAAYLADNNPFWALNVLAEYLAANPPACQARAWAAWVQIKQANLDEARALLEVPECSTPPETQARFLVLRALIAHHQQRTAEAARLLEEARAVGTLYAEDRDLLDDLSSRYDPSREPIASWSVEGGIGYTTNGLAGAPVDEATKADADSMVVLLGANVRAVSSNSGPVRAILEGQVRAQELTSDAASDYSYRLFSVRPGILIGRSLPRLELRYAAEALQLQGGDRYDTSGPMWYSEAHRAEYDLQPLDSLSVFGGVGYRVLRDRVRTRFELDEGLAWFTSLGSSTSLILGASARWYSARASAYTEFGGTLLSQLDVRLFGDLGIRGNLSVSGDMYPYSEGYFPSAAGRERREVLSRGGVGLWWPAQSQLRGAVEYTYARRDSTAADYSYVDHRALFRIQWMSDSDRLFSTVVPREGRVPLEAASAARRGQGQGTSVRELLRQDEAAQRSSSCLK